MTTSASAARRPPIGATALVVLPPLVTLIVGLTHPAALTGATAEWWRDLHIVLLPVFPLVGAGAWAASRGAAVPWRAIAALGGFVFAVFYDGLDVLAGIGAGSVQLAGHPEAKSALFAVANVLGPIGCAGLAVAWLAVAVGALRTRGWGALVALLGVAAAGLIQKSHVYFPVGTIGLALLVVAGLTILLLPGRAARRTTA